MVLALDACSASKPSAASRVNRPTLHIMSALPLFWREGQEANDLGLASDQRSAFVRELSGSYRVEAKDFLSPESTGSIDLLLLAQPRALQPVELVALDKWVSGGGRLLVFADPKLDWPSSYPLGDRRRPPFVTLLDPLLDHWGLQLNGGAEQDSSPSDAFIGGEPVMARSPGIWSVKEGGRCWVSDQGFVASCRLGKGQVRLIADADLLNFDDSEIDAAANLKAIVAILDSLSTSRGRSVNS